MPDRSPLTPVPDDQHADRPVVSARQNRGAKVDPLLTMQRTPKVRGCNVRCSLFILSTNDLRLTSKKQLRDSHGHYKSGI